MNFKIIVILSAIIFSLASCHKCETCVPHLFINGVLSPAADNTTASVKLCDKRDIDAYQSLTGFTDGSGAIQDTVRFICQ